MHNDAPPRFVVCGDDNLAYRLVSELVRIHGAEVTVVLRSGEHTGVGPAVEDIPGVEVVRATRIDRNAYRQAGLTSADALALVAQDDGGNVDAALVAREIAPDVRIVMRMFDETLAESMRDLLVDCEVLSAAAVATPSLVAAALGDDLPTALHLGGRVLYVTERDNTRDADILCALSVTEGLAEPIILPDASDRADLVLTTAVTRSDDDDAPDPTAGRAVTPAMRVRMIRRRARRRAMWAMTSLVGRRLRLVIGVLIALLIASTCALVAVRHLGWWTSAYVATLTAFGGANASLRAGLVERILQILLTIVSIALIPAATAAVVEAMVSARLALAAGDLAVPAHDHYVVVGLGDVGTRVLVALDDAGEAVVGIDLDSNARGIAVARQRRVPVIVGDAKRESTMRAAYAQTARGLLALTSNDVSNLETALFGRKLNPRLRTVLRLFDGGFADRAQRAFGFAVSRSVSNLAAPSFAAAMLGRDVIATISIRRRVLLVADVPVGAGSDLDGAPVTSAIRNGEVRVIGVRTGRDAPTHWAPPLDRVFADTDRVLAVTTRAGLGWLLARSTPAEPARESDPIRNG